MTCLAALAPIDACSSDRFGTSASNDGGPADAFTSGDAATPDSAGDAGDGASPPCSQPHLACVDFEDGMLLHPGFTTPGSAATIAVDSTLGRESHFSMKVTSAQVDAGAAGRFGVLQYDETSPQYRPKATLSASFFFQTVPTGNVDLMMLRYTDVNGDTVANIGFSMDLGELHFERSTNAVVAIFQPLGFHPAAGKWFRLVMSFDADGANGPSAALLVDGTPATVVGIGGTITGVAATKPRFGLPFIDSAQPLTTVNADDLTIDFP